MWVALSSTTMKTKIMTTVPIATTAKESRSQMNLTADCSATLSERDPAGMDVIDPSDYFYFAGVDARGDDLGVLSHRLHVERDVLDRPNLEPVARETARGEHRRRDLLDDLLNVAGLFNAVADIRERCLHCTALAVAEDDDQLRFEHAHAKLDRAEGIVAEKIPGDANDENLAGELIEERFDGQARVRTGQNDRERLLIAGKLGDARPISFVLRGAGHEARVAGFEPLERFGGIRGGGHNGTDSLLASSDAACPNAIVSRPPRRAARRNCR